MSRYAGCTGPRQNPGMASYIQKSVPALTRIGARRVRVPFLQIYSRGPETRRLGCSRRVAKEANRPFDAHLSTPSVAFEWHTCDVTVRVWDHIAKRDQPQASVCVLLFVCKYQRRWKCLARCRDCPQRRLGCRHTHAHLENLPVDYMSLRHHAKPRREVKLFSYNGHAFPSNPTVCCRHISSISQDRICIVPSRCRFVCRLCAQQRRLALIRTQSG